MTPLDSTESLPTTHGLTLRDVSARIRHRLVTTLIFVGIFFGAILSALLLPRKYEAEMKLLMNQGSSRCGGHVQSQGPIGAHPVPQSVTKT